MADNKKLTDERISQYKEIVSVFCGLLEQASSLEDSIFLDEIEIGLFDFVESVLFVGSIEALKRAIKNRD